ncbi:MAG TPA: glycosyltransferase [Solirubrobacteraceae bacterium]|nr:glycosyltransferase [Solirubrobacteraceae bacterium]
MRVLHLQQQPCMRALKYAVGLRAVRTELELGFAYRGRTLTEFYGSGDELFDHWWRLGEDLAGDLERVIAEWEPDLIHSHNLPDLLTVLALELTDVPVIHDVHDMQSLRSTPYEDGFPDPGDPAELERAAVEGCAGLITVSDVLLGELAARYELPAHTRVHPNYALARDLPATLPEPTDGPPRLVYQGTLSSSGGHYDLHEIFEAIAAQEIELHVYPAREAPSYRPLAGVTVHDPLPPAALMAALPSYDFGWAGFNAKLNAAHLDTALPNKAFEYVGCGLPVVTLRHRALARLVEEEGIGLTLDRVEELGAALEAVDRRAVRTRVAAARGDFTVEGNMGPVVGLYDELSLTRPARTPTGPPAL